MTRCVTDLALERYLVGELDGFDERAHIAGCERCRATLTVMQRAGDAYMASSAARIVEQRITAAEPARMPRRAPQIARMLAAVLAIAGVVAIVAWPRGPTELDPEAEVLAVERAWSAAYVHNDADALDAILATDYTLTDAAGAVSTKADDLARVRAGTVQFDVYDTTDLHVRVWGDTAVVTGRSRLRGRGAHGPFAQDITFTDTLAQIDGRWRAVAAHISKTRRP